jgi:colicin import membrane protein
MVQKVAEAERVRLARVEREANTEIKKKAAASRRLEAAKVERRKRMALEKEAEEARRLEAEKRQREALQKESEAERVRAEVAFELGEAAVGHDEEALERCLAAAKRNGVAKPDMAVAKAKLKALGGAREAAAELRGLLDDPTATRPGLESALRRAEVTGIERHTTGVLIVRAREWLDAEA